VIKFPGLAALFGNSAIVNRLVHVSKKAPDGSVRNYEVQRILFTLINYQFQEN
jgi:hypothetical protein